MGAKDFLAEPFVDAFESKLPLHVLQAARLDVGGLKEECKKLYLTWAATRLNAVLEYISTVCRRSADTQRVPTEDLTHGTRHPLEDMPHLIVFPEYSIPLDHLPLVYQWATTNHDLFPLVFAGTHSLPPRTPDSQLLYEQCKIDPTQLARAYGTYLSTKAVLPIFYATGDPAHPIRSTIRLKQDLSPFERTNFGSRPRDREYLAPITGRLDIPVPGHIFAINPFICSEALQERSLAGESDFDAAVIVSYSKPDPFRNIIDQIARNQRLVVFANDGLYGGSGFMIPPAERGESWWLADPNYGRLPTGDGIVIGEVNLSQLGEVVGVNNPKERCYLLRLSTLVPNNPEYGSYVVSKCLERLRLAESSFDAENLFSVNLALRRRVLTDCLELHMPDALQTLKLYRLLSLNDIDPALWKFYGDDAVYPCRCPSSSTGVQPKQPSDLRKLEQDLTAKCLAELKLLQAHDYDHKQKESLGMVLRQLEARLK